MKVPSSRFHLNGHTLRFVKSASYKLAKLEKPFTSQ